MATDGEPAEEVQLNLPQRILLVGITYHEASRFGKRSLFGGGTV
jgi:hypothetical protein